MENAWIFPYDAAFYRKLDKLGAALESGDRRALKRCVIDDFGYLFRGCQAQARLARDGAVPEGLSEAQLQELCRPLSWRQYRMVENAFGRYRENADEVLCSLWEFLSDEGRVGEKTVMSTAEVSGASIIYEQICIFLADE